MVEFKMSPSQSPAKTSTTQHSKGIQELGHEKDRLKLLLDMTNNLVSNLEPRDLLRAISASIRQDMHCDVVGVWLPDAEGLQLRQLAQDFPESNGFSKEDVLQPVEDTELGDVFKTGKPFVLRTQADVTSEFGISAIRAESLLSGFALPLISRNRTLGVLTLGSRIENSFSPEDVDFLMRAAGQVAIAIENALAYREIAELKNKLAHEKLYLEEEIRTAADFEGIVGQSSALRQVLQLVETVATSDSTVLLLGETGTGKELIAQAIHDRSRRKERTLIKLNCAAIPTGLLESELFGTNAALSQAPSLRKLAGLNWPIKELCFSTKWVISPWNSNPNFCAFCRTENSSAWEARGPRKSTFGWWPRPIATWTG